MKIHNLYLLLSCSTDQDKGFRFQFLKPGLWMGNVIAASRSGRFQPLCGDYERIRIMRKAMDQKIGYPMHRFPTFPWSDDNPG